MMNIKPVGIYIDEETCMMHIVQDGEIIFDGYWEYFYTKPSDLYEFLHKLGIEADLDTTRIEEK